MDGISGFVQRISGRHKQLPSGRCEPQLVHRLHQRLIDALARTDRDALEQLLATDAEWRRGKQTLCGRNAVIDALLTAGDNAHALVDAAHVRMHGEFAVVDALWQTDVDGRLRTWARSCILALRRGYWQVVSLRDLAFDQRAAAARADANPDMA